MFKWKHPTLHNKAIKINVLFEQLEVPLECILALLQFHAMHNCTEIFK